MEAEKSKIPGTFTFAILNEEQRELGKKLRHALDSIKNKTGVGVTYLFWNEIVVPFLERTGEL